MFDEHHPRVLRYALRRCTSAEAAEDAAAEVFLVAWRRVDEVPPDSLPWLFATARRVIANQRRGLAELATGRQSDPRDCTGVERQCDFRRASN